MTNFAVNDQKSLVLMAALQLQPRASWSMLAPILGVSATTLARRWQALTEQGRAWITCSPAFPSEPSTERERGSDWFFLPPYGSTAYIEVRCRPGERDSVLAGLIDDPRCWTIACTSGTRDLTVAVTLPSPQALDDFIQNQLGTLPGVLSLRANPLRGFLQAPSRWRIGGLTVEQREALMRLPIRRPPGMLDHTPSRRLALDQAVMRELAVDGRASASSIAKNIGYSVSSVNDSIAHVLQSGLAEWRLDLAQGDFGWDVMATLSLCCPQSRVHPIGTQLRRFSLEVREAVSTVGGENMQVHVWARQMDTLDAVEEMLGTQFPDVRVADRWVSTRFAKRAGVVLDDYGRRVRVTPMFPAL